MTHLAITNIGSRSSNQDTYFAGENLFIVCDGVGGRPYGEVASKLAASSIAEYFQNNPSSLYDSTCLNNSLHYTIRKFQETETKYPETSGMSTTIVFLAFDNDGATIAWLGDSRCYHIRSGEVLFVTEDHSLINELAKQGPDVSNIGRNIITKSLSAKTDYPFSAHRITRKQIRQGDLFLVCTDGVLENITNEILCTELNTTSTLEEKAQKIFYLCDGRTRDNFTFQIIEV